MRIGKYNIHLHSISVHFTNALYPVAFFFMVLFLLSSHAPYRHTYFHLMLLGTVAVPVSFASGIIEWKQKYKGARVRIFSRKYTLGPVLFILGAICTLWYVLNNKVMEEAGIQRILFIITNFSILPLNVYLGYLGGRLVFGGGH